nr:NAD(P)/FAD-dependent oxidoreductase [Variovorax boronicumulans]
MVDAGFGTRETPGARLLVVGGGIAGLEIATVLGRQWRGRPGAPTVTLLDRDAAHVWKPMLHTIAAGTRDIATQQTTYVAQARDAGFVYQPGALSGLDRQRRVVQVAPLHAEDGRLLVPARALPYELLVLAVGSQANDFGTPGVAEHCHAIDSRLQADAFCREVRLRMLQCVAMGQPLSIAIVGGGATGVELAAELVQLTETAEAYGARGLANRITITLLEAGPRLLAAFPRDISAATQQRLHSLGVRVRTGTQVQAARAEGLELADGSLLAATLQVWAAGVKGPAVLAGLDGLETSRSQQLVVKPSLQTTRDDAIYAVGDCASLTLPGSERPLPPTAQVAHQQARHLVRHLPEVLASGRPVPPFRFRDFGALVSLADYDAFGSLGRFGFFDGGIVRGRLAQLSHAMLYRSHQARLHGFWRGGLLWLADRIQARVRPPIRLD